MDCQDLIFQMDFGPRKNLLYKLLKLPKQNKLILQYFSYFITTLISSSYRHTHLIEYDKFPFYNMDIQTSVKTCFNRYATFSGRASRSEFWFFQLFIFLISIASLIIDVMILGYSIDDKTPIHSIFTLIILIPSIAVGCRRLHDYNLSGWWQLLYFTIIGIILLLVWWATQGESKKNRFGPPINFKE